MRCDIVGQATAEDWRGVRAELPDALNVARQSDLIALVPGSCMREGRTAAQGLQGFDLPVTTPELGISMMWHPRLDADPAHNWLRDALRATLRID